MRARILIATGLLFFSTAVHAYQVEAENLPSEKYFETTLKEITAAKSSVFLVMYLISLSPTQGNGLKSPFFMSLSTFHNMNAVEVT